MSLTHTLFRLVGICLLMTQTTLAADTLFQNLSVTNENDELLVVDVHKTISQVIIDVRVSGKDASPLIFVSANDEKLDLREDFQTNPNPNRFIFTKRNLLPISYLRLSGASLDPFQVLSVRVKYEEDTAIPGSNVSEQSLALQTDEREEELKRLRPGALAITSTGHEGVIQTEFADGRVEFKAVKSASPILISKTSLSLQVNQAFGFSIGDEVISNINQVGVIVALFLNGKAILVSKFNGKSEDRKVIDISEQQSFATTHFAGRFSLSKSVKSLDDLHEGAKVALPAPSQIFGTILHLFEDGRAEVSLSDGTTDIFLAKDFIVGK